MIVLLIITAAAVILSLVFDRHKTFMGIKKGYSMFVNIFFPFMTVLALVSVFLALVPNETIIKYLGSGSGAYGFITAAVIGSISLIPGFIAFPLGAILVSKGVTYKVIAVFITTLMMVGIFTLPLESKYFGWKPAVMRNLLSFISAIIIGLAMGLLWGYL